MRSNVDSSAMTAPFSSDAGLPRRPARARATPCRGHYTLPDERLRPHTAEALVSPADELVGLQPGQLV